MSERKHNEKTDEVEISSADNFEDTEIETTEAMAGDKLKLLRQKLKACEEEKRHYLEDLQRTKADFLNARKRLEEERGRDKNRITNDFISELLPLCDSFHVAMSNQELWQSVNPEWRQGIEGINSQLKSILNRYQVKQIDPTGEAFDPTRHDAMSSVVVANKEQDHKVIDVIQPGYEREVAGQVETIRPARVTVGEYKQAD